MAPGPIEAPLLARRLTRWGAVLVDHALDDQEALSLVRSMGDTIAQRIVLITPSERHRLPALKAAGFTGYLVKPVRAASLKARLCADDDAFDGAAVAADIAPTMAEIAADTARNFTVLVAEDNEINALLSKLGHHPTMQPAAPRRSTPGAPRAHAARPTIWC